MDPILMELSFLWGGFPNAWMMGVALVFEGIRV